VDEVLRDARLVVDEGRRAGVQVGGLRRRDARAGGLADERVDERVALHEALAAQLVLGGVGTGEPGQRAGAGGVGVWTEDRDRAGEARGPGRQPPEAVLDQSHELRWRGDVSMRELGQIQRVAARRLPGRLRGPTE
jgi:hypothetical protein